MKIAHIECSHLYWEYPEGHSFTTPVGPVKGRLCSLVHVHLDDGRVGVGSAYAHPGLVQVTVDYLLPFLKGRALVKGDDAEEYFRDNDRIAALWRLMYLWTRWSGRKGAVIVAMGGIDQALWDLRGQIQGKPVWELLGGSSSKVPAYASGLLYSSPAELAEKATAAISRGYRRVKMRIGWNWNYDLAAAEAVREAIGADHDLLCDGTQRFDMESAVLTARELERLGAFWFEEPFEPQELQLHRELRRLVDIPIAGGENEFGFEGFSEMVREQAADILQADASRCGGISEVRRVADLAAAEGLRLAPHSWCDPVAVVSNGHVVAAYDNAITVEVDQTGNGFIEHLLGHPLQVEDGELDLGTKPGLGIELDEGFVRDTRLDSPFDLPEGNHCDLLIGPPSIMQPIGRYVGPRSTAT